MKLATLACLLLLICCGSAAAQYPLDLNKSGITLPKTNDPFLSRVLYSARTVYYRLPQVYQHLGRHRHGSTEKFLFGVYYTGFLRDTNANLDFPWETTLGLNYAHRRSDNPYEAFNFVHLPVDKDTQRTIPILVIPEFPEKWIFPEGTVVGEAIYVTHRGKKYVQEVRTRTKEEGSLFWAPQIWRPVATRQEFVEHLGYDYTPAKKHVFLRNPEEDEVFKLEGIVERLPPMEEFQVKRLLSQPFKDVTESRWTPSADQDFHILPKDYSLGALRVTRRNCMNCHRQTQISVTNLIPKEPIIKRNPNRVGRIRGCDGVFTWYPFTQEGVAPLERACPSPQAEYIPGRDMRWYRDSSRKIDWKYASRMNAPTVPTPELNYDAALGIYWVPINTMRRGWNEFREFDVRNGLVIEFKPSMYDNARGRVIVNGHTYQLTYLVQESLQGDELPSQIFLRKKQHEPPQESQE